MFGRKHREKKQIHSLEVVRDDGVMEMLFWVLSILFKWGAAFSAPDCAPAINIQQLQNYKEG